MLNGWLFDLSGTRAALALQAVWIQMFGLSQSGPSRTWGVIKYTSLQPIHI